MQWSEHALGTSDELYTGVVKESDDVDEALRELWRKFIRNVLPKHSPEEWTYAAVEFWADSGRVIVYPARDLERRERAVCQLIIESFENEWGEIGDAELNGEVDADEFARRIADVERRYSERVIHALRQVLAEFRDPEIVNVKLFNFEDTEPFEEQAVSVTSMNQPA